MEPSNLAVFWAGVITCAIFLYVILDGFDLGVGILYGTTHDEQRRVQMMNSIAPFWDGNETWLIVVGAGLFAAFPDVYAIFLGALYAPVLLLMFGLIFRGVAFEFRNRSERLRPVWDWGFFLGSVIAAFVQGAAVGVMLRGIPVANGQYAGGALEWLHPFTILTGIGLVLGYALLGAGWVVMKGVDELRDWAYRRIPWLVAGVIVAIGLAFTVTFDYHILAHSNLHDRPWAIVFPALGLLSLIGVLVGARRRRDGVPFAMTVLFFLAVYFSLGVTFWPYMIPYSITVANAAAPDQSLQFLFYGAVVVLPVIIVYTISVYSVFRGKVRGTRYG